MLDGYNALDLTQFAAGPAVIKLMTEMGAEVIKVKLAPDGDRSRGMLAECKPVRCGLEADGG